MLNERTIVDDHILDFPQTTRKELKLSKTSAGPPCSHSAEKKDQEERRHLHFPGFRASLLWKIDFVDRVFR